MGFNMKNIKYVSNSETDTKNLAKKLASQLSVGDIIILSGELGSGKTKFTEGFLSFFGLENEISSPTFTIVNEYRNDKIKIFHFDVYRLEDLDEFYAIGGDEYFNSGICIIEWGELIKNALPDSFIEVIFSKDCSSENTRLLNINLVGDKYKNISI